ncbi:hypothetical protein CAAN1_11S05820 [[Candida] anglica]|uniref:Uncharacterized protein n=1 Tax=[Candida] anglica TaxID=148631 RepID=A0ABP0EHL7_9ASCO
MQSLYPKDRIIHILTWCCKEDTQYMFVLFALSAGLLKLEPQVRQLRSLVATQSSRNISYDYQLFLAISYACSVISALLYTFNDTIAKQYLTRYPVAVAAATESPSRWSVPVSYLILVVDMLGLVLSFCITRRLLKTEHHNTQQGISTIAKCIIFIITVFGVYMSYLVYNNRSALFWLDVIDYIWLIGVSLAPVSLFPQLVMHWYVDSTSPGLPVTYLRSHSISLAFLIMSKVAIRTANVPYYLMPTNLGDTFYYISVQATLLVVLTFQRIIYSRARASYIAPLNAKP